MLGLTIVSDGQLGMSGHDELVDDRCVCVIDWMVSLGTKSEAKSERGACTRMNSVVVSGWHIENEECLLILYWMRLQRYSSPEAIGVEEEGRDRWLRGCASARR